jgi:hypothetical protein
LVRAHLSVQNIYLIIHSAVLRFSAVALAANQVQKLFQPRHLIICINTHNHTYHTQAPVSAESLMIYAG